MTIPSASVHRPADRTEIVGALRQLADWLDANPEVPVNPWGWDLMVFPAGPGDDIAGQAEISRVAALMAVTAASTDSDKTDWIALRRFGPITYQAIYITSRRMRSHQTLMSYSGDVPADPASPPEAA